MSTRVAILEGVKTNGKAQSRLHANERGNPNESPNDAGTGRLARLLAAYAPHDGSFEMRVPGVHASRFSRVNKECVHALRVPSLCIVAQGAKTVIVADDVFEHDASRM